jgi:DNA-binding transcriptional LysR family regulator
MAVMDLRGVDLNLLVVFEAIASHGSVTLAAEALGLSQPATSSALRRLRELFEDPLFVKTGLEMKPTPRALQVAASVRQVLDTVRTEILPATAFVPALAKRTFNLMTPDIGESSLLPTLLLKIESEAPGVDLRAVSLPRHAAADALARGPVELALGYYPDLHQGGVFQQILFRNEHVCMVRRDHPHFGTSMTLAEFLAADHAVVRPEGREHVFEQFLRQQGLRLKIRLEVSHFMSLLPIVSESNLIAVVPFDLACVCERYGAVRLVELPLRPPAIDVHQYWHARFQKDPGHEWLRGLIKNLFSAPRPSGCR